MRKKQVGSYLLTEETGYLKVSHENKSFNFRISANDEACNSFFRNLRENDTLNAYSAVFAAIQVSTIMAMQNPDFAIRLMQLIKGDEKPEISKEEDDEILKEQKALHEMGEDSECTE